MVKIDNDLTKDEREIIALADEMASAMASLNAQTYETFINARDSFRAKIKEICNKQISTEERIKRIKETISSL